MAGFANISIRNKLIFIQVATACIAILICCIIFVINDIQTYKESSVRNKNSIAEIVGFSAVSPLWFEDRETADTLLLNFKSNPSILNAAIFDKNGKVFSRYDKSGEENFSFSFSNGNDDESQNSFGQKYVVSYPIYQQKELLGSVKIRAELSDLNTIIVSYLKAAGLILIISLFAALMISSLLQRLITGRLLSLVTKAKEVAETGNYSNRISTEGDDEITILSKELNNMMEQIQSAQNALKDINADLEKRVLERTEEIEHKIKELEELNEELKTFTYSVSHDLRAPLRAVSGFSTLVLKDYSDKLDAEGQRMLNILDKSARKMAQLIDDLMSYSRVGRSEISLKEVDMTKLADNVMADLRQSYPENKAEVTLGSSRKIKCDEILMKQALQNLLGNALKYSAHSAAPRIRFDSYRHNNETVFYVKDNGAGFDMAYSNKLFGMFQRLHSTSEFEGTGVGLAIVQRIIQRHGGKVWAEGKVNEGATFYFSLPDKNQNNYELN